MYIRIEKSQSLSLFLHIRNYKFKFCTKYLLRFRNPFSCHKFYLSNPAFQVDGSLCVRVGYAAAGRKQTASFRTVNHDRADSTINMIIVIILSIIVGAIIFYIKWKKEHSPEYQRQKRLYSKIEKLQDIEMSQ